MSESTGPAGPDSPRAVERDRLVWALGELHDLLRRGIITDQVFAALQAEFQARLDGSRTPAPAGAPGEPVAASPSSAASGLPAAPETPPPVPVAADPGHLPPPVVGPAPAAATPPAAPRRAARSGEVSGPLWINLLLYLGAFFVVMAALIFVSYSWRSLGGLAKVAIMFAFTGAFLTAGGGCLRLPKVRLAGNTFLAIGALLTPLDIVALYNFVLRAQGLNRASVWAWGSLYCALFYGALALSRLGRVYAFASTVAIVSAWTGLLARLDVDTAWWPPAFMALPLLLLVAARLGERYERFRQGFGFLPLGAALLLAPPTILAALITILLSDHRTPPAIAAGLALLLYVSTAATQPPGALRLVTILGALVVAPIFVLAVGNALYLPPRAFPALLLGLSWALLALALLAERRGWSWSALVLGAIYIQLAILLVPWSIAISDRHGAYWAGLYGVVLCFIGALLWRARRPWLVYPAALASGIVLFHALRAGVGTELAAPFAWGYAALALLLLALAAAARQLNAPRSWDFHPLAASQIAAIVATALATGSGAQLTILGWLFTGAGVVAVILERRPAFLVLPNVWGAVAIAAALHQAGVGARWAPAVYAAVGLAIALGLQAWRAVPAQRRPDWFVAQRWSAGVWAVLGIAIAAALLARPAIRFLSDWELLDLVLYRAYGPATLATFLCALTFFGDAIVTMRRPTGYGSSAFFAAALLLAIARVTPNNPQAYAVPLGIYLLGLSIYVAYEDELGPVRMPAANALLASAVIVMLGTTFAQSFAHPLRYILLGLVEGLALLAFTLFLRRRYGVALSLAFLVLTVVRALFDAANTLPNWAVIGFLGLALLVGAVAILAYRDQFERWVEAAAARWARLM